MKPYYETENGCLYHGRCEDILPKLKSSSLILTDPPYGKNIAKSGKIGGGKLAKVKQYTASEWDLKTPPRIAFELMRSKSIHQIIFGGNYFSSFLPPSHAGLFGIKKQQETLLIVNSLIHLLTLLSAKYDGDGMVC